MIISSDLSTFQMSLFTQSTLHKHFVFLAVELCFATLIISQFEHSSVPIFASFFSIIINHFESIYPDKL